MKKSMSKNIILNCIKTGLSVFFPLITYPYITRTIGAVGLGKVNFIGSIISYFVLLASLGVITYSVREGAALRDKTTERDAFFNEVFSVNFLSMLFAYLCLTITFFISAKLHNYLCLIIIQSLTMLFNWIGVEWVFNIYEDYYQITLRTLFVQIISIVCMFIFVHTPEDYMIYAAITVFANGGSFVFNYFLSRKYYRPKLVVHCNIKKHLKPMLILTANLVAVTIYVNADMTMIGYMINEDAVGYYSLGVKVYTIIKQVFNAIIVSASARVAFYYLNEHLQLYEDLLKKISKLIVLLIFPAITGLILLSQDIIFVLGDTAFRSTTSVLRVLSVALFFATFGSFYSSFGLIVKRKEKLILLITSIGALINIVLNLFMIPLFGIIGASVTTLISELVVCIIFAFKSEIRIFKQISHSIISAIFAIMFVFVVCYFSSNISSVFLKLFISVTFSGIVVLVFYYFRKEELITEKVDSIIKKIINKD